jgi:OFA family oxalate/formate antiporter-like MFS transporter
MMGFGASSLILGKLAENMFNTANIGWKNTFILIGIVLGVVLVLSGLFMKKPDTSVQFPTPKSVGKKHTENFETKDFTTKEMLKRASFCRRG